MGSSEAPPYLKRPFLLRPRSRLARFLLLEKVDYVQWLCTVAAFFMVVLFFESFLPLTTDIRSTNANKRPWELELGELDFGEGISFVPTKLLERFERERREEEEAALGSRRRGLSLRRFGVLRPRNALVVADLCMDGKQLQMVTVAVALKEMGYDLEVLSLDDGSARSTWVTAGFSLSILSWENNTGITVDWLRYNAVLVNSLEAKPIIGSLSQEPFKSVPVIWTIYERSLALRIEEYKATNRTQLINNWRQAFGRATVITFPNHFLPMLYTTLDPGNYYIVPGSAVDAWMATGYCSLHEKHDLRTKMGYKSEDFLIAIVGSVFSYSGFLLERALVLEAIGHLSLSHLKVGFLNCNTTNGYNTVLEEVALKFGFSRGSIRHVDFEEDTNPFLSIADIVVYGSFLEEQSFPSALIRAMCLGKLIVAPDLSIIEKYVDDGINAYIFPKNDISMLTRILTGAIMDERLSPSAQSVAFSGKELAKNLMVSETVEGYAFLLENILKLPSEFKSAKTAMEIPSLLRKHWRWELFENISHFMNPDPSFRRSVVDDLEKPQDVDQRKLNSMTMKDGIFSSINWIEEKAVEVLSSRKRLLEGELKDRTDQYHGTWEEVYRNAKRADRAKNTLHEVDDRELERAGQPLCIYEPYFGDGTWPFLHNTSLYRGIGLSTKGRRRGTDDIDASSRLQLLSNPYYRDIFGDSGAFFALANRVDRIHKNAWIGFQSWRATAAKVSLSKKAEALLLEAIESRKFGDALYYWVHMDSDPRNSNKLDFWSFCDSINAGNCRFSVSGALRRMYKMPNDWDLLPPMPADGDSWSVMHSWALPTKSFLEFVMFSRIFVDALDAEMHDEHKRSGTCYLSLSKDPHCYSRVLELLVNVWAYHSARRMVYVDPNTGTMLEQHAFRSRRGKMWIKWFSPALLKSMDEELAEEWDVDHPNRRWLWPKTGEVFWHGIYERERSLRHQQREMRKRESKEKMSRMRRRTHQKALGKYIMPPPEGFSDSNTTSLM